MLGRGRGSVAARIEYIDKKNQCTKNVVSYLAERFSTFNLSNLLSFNFDFYCSASSSGQRQTADSILVNECLITHQPYIIALALDLDVDIEEITNQFNMASEQLSQYFNALQMNKKLVTNLTEGEDGVLVDTNSTLVSQMAFNPYYDIWSHFDKLFDSFNDQRSISEKQEAGQMQIFLNCFMKHVSQQTIDHFHAATDEEKANVMNKIQSFLTESREKLDKFSTFVAFGPEFDQIVEQINQLPAHPFPEAVKARNMWQKVSSVKDELGEPENYYKTNLH